MGPLFIKVPLFYAWFFSFWLMLAVLCFRLSVFIQFSCVNICSSQLVILCILFVIINHFTKVFVFFSSLYNC